MSEVDIEDEMGDEAPTSPKAPKHVPTGKDSFVERSWAVQGRIQKRWDAIGKGRIARVLRMARKPEPEEFRQSAMIVLVGIAVIGALGFFTYLFMSWLLNAVTPT